MRNGVECPGNWGELEAVLLAARGHGMGLVLGHHCYARDRIRVPGYDLRRICYPSPGVRRDI